MCAKEGECAGQTGRWEDLVRRREEETGEEEGLMYEWERGRPWDGSQPGREKLKRRRGRRGPPPREHARGSGSPSAVWTRLPPVPVRWLLRPAVTEPRSLFLNPGSPIDESSSFFRSLLPALHKTRKKPHAIARAMATRREHLWDV